MKKSRTSKTITSSKSNKTSKSDKLKSEEPSPLEETIEFIWSVEVQKAWSRMKKQLQNPFMGRIPPIPGVIDCKEDILISQLAPMYSLILQDRKNKKIQKESKSYDPYSLRYVIRNFCSSAFFEKKKSSKQNGVENRKKSETQDEESPKQEKVTFKEQINEHSKSQAKPQSKVKDEAKLDNQEQVTKPEEVKIKSWNVNIPCPNIFPGLHITPSMMSLISEPVEIVTPNETEDMESLEKYDEKNKTHKKEKQVTNKKKDKK